MLGTSRRVYEDHDHVRRVLADQGGLRWDVFIAEPASPVRSIVPPGPPGFWKRLGFDYKRLGARRATYAIGNPAVVSAGTDYDGATVEAPAWSLALLASVPLSLRAGQYVRGRRWSRAGRCRQCGYDLRGTPGQCPECGTPSAAE